MKNDEKKLIAQSYIIEQPLFRKELGNEIYKIVENYTYAVIEDWEDFCIDSLYDEYQKLGLSKVFVINRKEFKKFLLWALPEYYRKFKDEK